MNQLARTLRRGPRVITNPELRAAVDDMTYELIPLKNLPARIEHLPAGARCSVTASPVKELEDTLDICADLAERGHRPIPHLAARKVRDRAHARSLAERCRHLGLREIFVIGGDAEDCGDYPDAMAFLREFLDIAAGDIDAVGIGSYPDGHALIDTPLLRAALMEKQELFAEAGVAGHASTQMCFSPDTIRRWVQAERAEGFELPIHLGIPGVVDTTKLMTMGMRLGVGASLRYLKKNRAGIMKLLTSPGYNPSTLLDPLARDMAALGITGLHVFTFNQVEATRAWQRGVLG